MKLLWFGEGASICLDLNKMIGFEFTGTEFLSKSDIITLAYGDKKIKELITEQVNQEIDELKDTTLSVVRNSYLIHFESNFLKLNIEIMLFEDKIEDKVSDITRSINRMISTEITQFLKSENKELNLDLARFIKKFDMGIVDVKLDYKLIFKKY